MSSFGKYVQWVDSVSVLSKLPFAAQTLTIFLCFSGHPKGWGWGPSEQNNELGDPVSVRRGKLPKVDLPSK